MSDTAGVLQVEAVDAHAAGAVLRMITGGFPVPRGRTMRDKARSLDRRDDLCRALALEPRGHDGITLGLLTDAVSADADGGVLFRRAGGDAGLSGHGLIAAATIAIERRLVVPRQPGVLRLDTIAGLISLTVELLQRGAEEPRASSVRYVGPPAFVLGGGVPVQVGERTVRTDVAWGGAFYAIVDGESAGVPLVRTRIAELQRVSAALLPAVERAIDLVYPGETHAVPPAGVIFTGPPSRDDAHLRCQVIHADGSADRCPSGTSVAAIVAVIAAMGFDAGEPVVIESLAGTTLTGRALDDVPLGEHAGVRVEVSGSAWIVAEHRFVIDGSDPLRDGMEW